MTTGMIVSLITSLPPGEKPETLLLRLILFVLNAEENLLSQIIKSELKTVEILTIGAILGLCVQNVTIRRTIMRGSMQRANGFYWVRYDDEWEIAKWEKSWRDEYQWALAGSELYRDDEDFQEIDERRIERGHNDIIELLKNNTKTHLPDYLSDNPYLCKPD